MNVDKKLVWPDLENRNTWRWSLGKLNNRAIIIEDYQFCRYGSLEVSLRLFYVRFWQNKTFLQDNNQPRYVNATLLLLRYCASIWSYWNNPLRHCLPWYVAATTLIVEYKCSVLRQNIGRSPPWNICHAILRIQSWNQNMNATGSFSFLCMFLGLVADPPNPPK